MTETTLTPEKTYLHVEDDEMLRNLLGTVLANRGRNSIISVATVEEGLQYIQSDNFSKLYAVITDGEIFPARGQLYEERRRLIGSPVGTPSPYHEGHLIIHYARERRTALQYAGISHEPKIFGFSSHDLNFDRNGNRVPSEFSPDVSVLKMHMSLPELRRIFS